jgi:hypothetical protein
VDAANAATLRRESIEALPTPDGVEHDALIREIRRVRPANRSV